MDAVALTLHRCHACGADVARVLIDRDDGSSTPRVIDAQPADGGSVEVTRPGHGRYLLARERRGRTGLHRMHAGTCGTNSRPDSREA